MPTQNKLQYPPKQPWVCLQPTNGLTVWAQWFACLGLDKLPEAARLREQAEAQRHLTMFRDEAVPIIKATYICCCQRRLRAATPNQNVSKEIEKAILNNPAYMEVFRAATPKMVRELNDWKEFVRFVRESNPETDKDTTEGGPTEGEPTKPKKSTQKAHASVNQAFQRVNVPILDTLDKIQTYADKLRAMTWVWGRLVRLEAGGTREGSTTEASPGPPPKLNVTTTPEMNKLDDIFDSICYKFGCPLDLLDRRLPIKAREILGDFLRECERNKTPLGPTEVHHTRKELLQALDTSNISVHLPALNYVDELEDTSRDTIEILRIIVVMQQVYEKIPVTEAMCVADEVVKEAVERLSDA